MIERKKEHAFQEEISKLKEQLKKQEPIRSDVLDHGYVCLEDWMGDDLRIVNMARQSFGQKSNELGTKEQGLINFLMRERHGTPFEGVVFTFNVKCPIFVAREWMRHRIGCLASDTPVVCVQPNGVPYPRSIEHLYRTHHGVEAPERWVKNGYQKNGNQARKKVPDALRYRALNQERVLRVLGFNGFTTGIMKNVWLSGMKELYLLKTKDGRELRASADHRIKTPEGWAKVSELSASDIVLRFGRVAISESTVPHKLRQAIGAWTTLQRRKVIGQGAKCYLCNQFFWEEDLHLDHMIPVLECLPKALDLSNLAPACKECHREKTNREQPHKARSKIGVRSDRLVMKPELVAEEMTYDIEMTGPNHNYLANQIVVHNSYNEYSGRYSKMISDFYIPNLEQIRTQKGKPGSYSFEPIDTHQAYNEQARIQEVTDIAWEQYEDALNNGVAKEVARMMLPVNIYTQFTWVVNLRSLFNFISLRSHEAAMWEIRQYSQTIEPLIKHVVPVAWEAFENNSRRTP